jgi:hypothetical protein
VVDRDHTVSYGNGTNAEIHPRPSVAEFSTICEIVGLP